MQIIDVERDAHCDSTSVPLRIEISITRYLYIIFLRLKINFFSFAYIEGAKNSTFVKIILFMKFTYHFETSAFPFLILRLFSNSPLQFGFVNLANILQQNLLKP